MTTLQKRLLAMVFLAAGCLALLTACKLPTYNLSRSQTPSQAFADFMEAVSSGDTDQANEILYHSSWSNGTVSASDPHMVNGQSVSQVDAELIDCIMQSRSWEFVSESDISDDGHHAVVTIRYTGFDVGKFRQALLEKVLAAVKQQQYQGKQFKDAADTADMIESGKRKLLAHPEDFYTTTQYDIEMISYKGHWRIVLSDEFYSALCGYTQ